MITKSKKANIFALVLCACFCCVLCVAIYSYDYIFNKVFPSFSKYYLAPSMSFIVMAKDLQLHSAGGLEREMSSLIATALSDEEYAFVTISKFVYDSQKGECIQDSRTPDMRFRRYFDAVNRGVIIITCGPSSARFSYRGTRSEKPFSWDASGVRIEKDSTGLSVVFYDSTR